MWDELIRTVHDQTGAERIRTRTLLEQYVAPEVAERLLKHGHNPIEVGEIREITVLFADIRNFTPLVTHLNLNDLRAFLNAFFDMLSEIIFRFQGTLDKFMGDAVLALFGSLLRNDQRPLKYRTIASVRASIVYSGGVMLTLKPCSSAVLAVTGPIQATATSRIHF